MNDKTRKALIEKLSNDSLNGLWLVEWNEHQKAFHVEPAESRFSDSIAAFSQKQKSGAWVSLGIFNSYKEAGDFVDRLRAKRGL